MKKTAAAIFFAVFLFSLAFAKAASAQSTFDFPSVRNGEILFYNQDFGEIQKFDSQNKISQVPGAENFGGFVHNLVWSPDGNRTFVLAENIQPAVGELTFYAPERPYGSLNWWVFDFDSKKATLLDKNILSIGWLSDNQAVYNWNNLNFSIVEFADSAPGVHTILAGIKTDSNDLNSVISPVSASGILLFPMKQGFYAIGANGKEIRYHAPAGGIQKVLTGIFGQNYFLVQSGNYLYKFTGEDQSLTSLDIPFPVTDMAFFGKNSLVVTKADKQAYLYDTEAKNSTPVSPGVPGSVSRIFSSGVENEFLFVVGKNIYRFSKNSSALLGLDWNTGGEHPLDSSPNQPAQSPQTPSTNGTSLTPVPAAQPNAPAESTKKNYAAIAIIAILAAIAGATLFLAWKKFLKNRP